ncbi:MULTISPECIES: FAD-binding protein [unclassified Beijerinckia]|uniref:FAD-binding protein n=1 Tax=unclassified Beijerinckia TaxID=2638183 RepID=UPI000896711A|nr:MULTISPECIES: FAD-binding protein [unclassified Beijerinckia]MDH7799166.1 succinate dehydrogenase/fumarate reductase flavoprotein subunit [Beijerinckia sp. GAS462]SED93117.1 succinate dehydrogenase / fumarate reductase flavoprotein subunit/fumarate reductase (CoM/CoB) subunit A [Beijerinckia sp. 28-YEA-48]
MPDIVTDVLVIGAGAAGMTAAITAAKAGASVLLVDKSLVGRGGATIMAQMTVAAALGEQAEDSWSLHLEDTLKAGRGICNEELAGILCREAPERIRELDGWNVGWARDAEGRINGVQAPGHSVPRCVYVDILNTGPAVAQVLRTQVSRVRTLKRVSGLAIRDLVVHNGRVVGAVGVNVDDGRTVTINAKATILAAGGLTKLFQRNSASTNMNGDAYALALRAGADLIDMEFPQFFPIGHLAPRLVGMDPIMWDPFRYKLGGRLLNGRMEEFLENYGLKDSGVYTAPRDVTAYAIVKENEAGRGSPAGGAYLSFMHVPEADLRAAFGPTIDVLAKNGIDLTKQCVEVAPIAHYHMGGVRVDGEMKTSVPGLYAAGEAVGGANGANRLSGNAIPEALVFGERAGRFAAAEVGAVQQQWDDRAAAAILTQIAEINHRAEAGSANEMAGTTKLWGELQTLMWEKVGLSRTQESLQQALERLRSMRTTDMAHVKLSPGQVFNTTVEEWFELRSSLEVAEMITLAALNRQESRGAHQRLDYPETSTDFERNQILRLEGAAIASRWAPLAKAKHV